MEHIPVTISSSNGTGDGPFWFLATKKIHNKTQDICQEEPRKPGTRSQVTEVRTFIQVSHLYLRALCEAACQTASECDRQAGGEDAFGVPTGIFPSPPRAAALAPQCGYPMSKNDEERTTKEDHHDEENQGKITERMG